MMCLTLAEKAMPHLRLVKGGNTPRPERIPPSPNQRSTTPLRRRGSFRSTMCTDTLRRRLLALAALGVAAIVPGSIRGLARFAIGLRN